MLKNIPKILIVGRPNVGKSTLINRLTKSKNAIIVDEPGVTRDVSEFPCEWNGKPFYLLDSAGILLDDDEDDILQSQAEDLVKRYLDAVDKVVFLTDFKDGVHPYDQSIANYLRPVKDKVVVAVNKSDNPDMLGEAFNFSRLGLGEPHPISAINGHGVSALLDLVTAAFTNKQSVMGTYKQAYKIAIVGRPNVGKSSLINAITNEERVLVSEIAGTTRDAVELYFNQGDNQYVFIDTAGLRRKAKVKESIEFYSTVRAKKSIQKADLVIMVLDSDSYLSEQDKKIINLIQDEKRNMLIWVNKWDIQERTDQNRKDLLTIAYDELPFLAHYPFIFGSAKEKHNIGRLINGIPDIIKRGETRIPTGQFNQWIEKLVNKTPPPSKSGKRLKIYYATQAENSPPTFIFFVNDTKLMDPKYRRYVEKQLREAFGGFEGNPILLYVKGKAVKGK